MGSACHRANRTKKITIRARSNQDQDLGSNRDQFAEKEVRDRIGQYFQYQAETADIHVMEVKKRQWNGLLQDKLMEYQNDAFFIEIKNSLQQNRIKHQTSIQNLGEGNIAPEPQAQNEIVDFMNMAIADNNEEEPEIEQINSRTNSHSKSKKLEVNPQMSHQQKFLMQIFKNKQKCYFLEENELLLYIFKNSQSEYFKELFKKGLPYAYRWAAWKVSLHDQDIYDEEVYEQLLSQNSPQDDESIRKDLDRTFSSHPYFKEALGLGQMQLYRVLKALATHHPKVGYCQGMNQHVAFLLITNGGNEQDAFWFLNNMVLNPKFMIPGIFQSGFPLSHILLFIFQRKFQQFLPALREHFIENEIIEFSYLWKWIITFFLYSFPIESVYRMWDYILATNILSLLSLSLSILDYYGAIFMNYDLGDFSEFVNRLPQTKNILSNRENLEYLDIDLVIRNADTKFKIDDYRQIVQEYVGMKGRNVYSDTLINDFNNPEYRRYILDSQHTINKLQTQQVEQQQQQQQTNIQFVVENLS